MPSIKLDKPVIYYHLWRFGDWAEITAHILDEIKKSGLSELATLNICVNDSSPTGNVEHKQFADDAVTVRNVAADEYEWPTIKLLRDEMKDKKNVPVLYLHCKGVTHHKGGISYLPTRDWTDSMLYYLVENYKVCMAGLKAGYHAVGCNRRSAPCPHFSGNFWWINSSYIKDLPDPDSKDAYYCPRFSFGWSDAELRRHEAEFWSGKVGMANMLNLSQPDLSAEYLRRTPREKYEGKWSDEAASLIR